MKMTHLESKEIYKTGDKNRAWVVAQMDDGWIGGITFNEWCQWMDDITS